MNEKFIISHNLSTTAFAIKESLYYVFKILSIKKLLSMASYKIFNAHSNKLTYVKFYSKKLIIRRDENDNIT